MLRSGCRCTDKLTEVSVCDCLSVTLLVEKKTKKTTPLYKVQCFGALLPVTTALFSLLDCSSALSPLQGFQLAAAYISISAADNQYSRLKWHLLLSLHSL